VSAGLGHDATVMPVVVTGASGLVGTAAIRAFRERAPEVRAYVRRKEAVEQLRALGAKVAVGEIDDVDTLAVVMRGAHTVCHLVGGLDLPDDDAYVRVNVGSVSAALDAARRAKVSRFLLLSYPGADSSSPNSYLRAKGRAESVLQSADVESVIVRCTHVYGPASPWLEQMRRLARGFPAATIGAGSQLIAPVFVEDVADVLAGADDRAHSVSGTWGLEGPDRLTVDAFADRLAGRRRRKMHLSPRTANRATRLVRKPVSLAALEILAADSLADPGLPDAAAEFGITRTSLDDGLRRSLER
jgi:uncharacterized protein YbjT (DUF2867 family)